MTDTNTKINEIDKKFSRKFIAALKRESYKDNNKVERYSYYIPVEYCNQLLKAHIQPKDVAGYDLLNTLFIICGDDVQVYTEDGQIKNNDTGEVVDYTSYFANTCDKDGIELDVPLKPANSSSKAILKLAKEIYNKKNKGVNN